MSQIDVTFVIPTYRLRDGTPVIGWRRGSVPEVSEDGVTGYVVDRLDAVVQAVKDVHLLGRAASRARSWLR